VTYFAGAAVVGAAGVEAAAGACFLCFFAFVVLVEVLLLGVVVEAAGACAIAVPIIRDRPARAEMMVFMVV
jgi:hypothetical protein